MSVSTLHLNKHSNPFKNDLEEAYPIKKKKLNTNSFDSILLEENKSFNFKISSEKNDNKNFIEKKTNPSKLNEIIQNKPSDNSLNFKPNRNRKEEVLLEPTNNSNNSKKINKSLQKYLNLKSLNSIYFAKLQSWLE